MQWLRRSLVARIVLYLIVGIIVLSGGTYLVTIQNFEAYSKNVLEQQIRTSMGVFKYVLRGVQNRDLTMKDGKLYAGNIDLSQDTFMVDRMAEMTGAVATVFQNDVRITTNIVGADGKRAVGTKLAEGPAYDAVMKRKEGYQGEATILNEPYYTQYEPILDGGQNVIGIIFVGVPKQQIEEALAAQKLGMLGTAGAVGLVIGVLLVLLIRKMILPVRGIEQAITRITANDLSITFPDKVTVRRDEVGSLAKAVLSFRDTLVSVRKMEADQEEAARTIERKRREEMMRMADTFEQNIGGVVNSVASAASEMQAIAASMERAAAQAAGQASEGNEAARDAAANVRVIT